jgi:HAD superfamily hydrolase (TIGR01509 family)
MLKIEAFAFDFDGVLADSLKAHTDARLEAFRQLGHEDVSQQIHDEGHKHGSHPPEIIGWILKEAKIVPSSANVLKDKKVQEVVSLKKEIFKQEAAEGLDAIPGSVEFVTKATKLYGPKRLAIATTATKEGEVLPFLDRHGLADSFGYIVAQEDTPSDKMKPHPFVYKEAARQLGHNLSSIIAIEDSPRGIESASMAGLYVYGLASTHKFEDLSGANQVIGSFKVIEHLVRD